MWYALLKIQRDIKFSTFGVFLCKKSQWRVFLKFYKVSVTILLALICVLEQIHLVWKTTYNNFKHISKPKMYKSERKINFNVRGPPWVFACQLWTLVSSIKDLARCCFININLTSCRLIGLKLPSEMVVVQSHTHAWFEALSRHYGWWCRPTKNNIWFTFQSPSSPRVLIFTKLFELGFL